MSTVDAVSSSTSAAAPSALAVPNPTDLKDQFMKLFIAQLQNQDPLSPQDSSAFVAQLAQLSQLEQSTETTKHLQSLADGQAASARAQLTSLVGHKVSASADSLEIRAGAAPLIVGAPGNPVIDVHFDTAASGAQLAITDAAGHTVRTIDLGSAPMGDTAVDWASKAGDLPPGAYKLSVTGKGSNGTALTGTTQINGVIDAMQIDDAGGRFRIGPFNVAPAAISSVGAVAP